jgi:DNA-binding NtrC family response regulator
MAKILVVDDDKLTRMMLNDALSEAGHQVIEADDGKKVAALLKQHFPHILITDIIMPDQEGIETILQMKREHPALPIIAISGHYNYLKMAETFGASAIMLKPIDEAQLLNKVDELLASL